MTTINPSDLEEDACQGSLENALYGDENEFSKQQAKAYMNILQDAASGSDSVTMVSQDACDADNFVTPLSAVDEETKLICASGSYVNSPRDIVSPSGEVSSPFSAMESDGEEMEENGLDEANLSCAGNQERGRRTNGFYGASTPLEYTTTPCPSSSACDDDYESTGSRKKRRKTKRCPHPYMSGPSVRFPKYVNHDGCPQDQDTSSFSPPCLKGVNFNLSGNNSRHDSSGINTSLAQDEEYPGDNAKRTRTCEETENDDNVIVNIKTESPTTMDVPVTTTKLSMRKRHKNSWTAGTLEQEQVLHRQYPRKIEKYELRIVAQPESQHRARYLTEGSRGPVKDSTLQGFPRVELIGYNGPAVLQVFVAADSGKIRPHGFYQACKVTGRNTSSCDEIEIEGTKVIEIPFKQEAGSVALSVDCVGILKLRNTDVEVRTGLRNQKRDQSVRLIFRTSLRVSSPGGDREVTLQAASTRISCTQPLGQPEISKKSSDRCSVEGGLEMFIIGKNFHRGTKVIYQDPEDPNGGQWSAEGEVDKDTFHQTHMVVRVPPYHDQSIVKPVNVQLLVEFQDKRCEPHSFTYTPCQRGPEQPIGEAKNSAQGDTGTPNIASALSFFDGPIDRKFLVALFAKLLAAETPTISEPQEQPKPEVPPQQPHPAVLTNPQAFINAAPMLRNILQPQAFVTATDATNTENGHSVAQPSPPLLSTSNPFANVCFTSQPFNASFTGIVSQGNPVQPATFPPLSPQVKFTAPCTNSISSTNPTLVQAKSEIPDAAQSKVVSTALQANPILLSSTDYPVPSTFASSSVSQSQTVFPLPQHSVVSPPLVISPTLFQISQPPLSEECALNSLSSSHTASVQQANPNPTFTTASLAASVTAQSYTVIGATVNYPPNQAVYGSQNIKQPNFKASSGTMSSPASSAHEQTAPVQNFQELPKQHSQADVFMNAHEQSSITQNGTATVQLQDMSSPVGLGQSALPQADARNVPTSIQYHVGQAPLPQSMLQENVSFQNSLANKEGSPVVQLVTIQNTTNKDLCVQDILDPSHSGLTGQPQQMFSVTGQGQTMQMHAQMSDQGQQVFSLGSFTENAIPQQPGVQMMPVQNEKTENQTNASHRQSSQEIHMHVDDPFMENLGGMKIQSQTTDIPQNGAYSTQSVTRITTVSDMQSMEVVTHSLSASQPMDLLVSPQEQQLQQPSLFNQMPQQNSNAAATHTPMVAVSYHDQLPSNSVAVSIGMHTRDSAHRAQNFQTVQQVNPLVGQAYSTSQTTATSVSFQPSITPVSMPASVFQSPPPTVQGSQTQSYQSQETATKSPLMMQPPSAAQHGLQSLSVQSQVIPMETRGPEAQGQLMDLQSQSLSSENHQLNPGSLAQPQVTNNFMYQDGNGVALHRQNTSANHNSSVHIPQAHHQNIALNQPLLPHSPDIYAMTKLLQSIDGSENLEAISREDVQRHCH